MFFDADCATMSTADIDKLANTQEPLIKEALPFRPDKIRVFSFQGAVRIAIAVDNDMLAALAPAYWDGFLREKLGKFGTFVPAGSDIQEAALVQVKALPLQAVNPAALPTIDTVTVRVTDDAIRPE